jgi:uncharacterized lipoprotein
MKQSYKFVLLVLILTALSACSVTGASVEPTSNEVSGTQENGENFMIIEPIDNTYEKSAGTDVIYLAGGCFWGLES